MRGVTVATSLPCRCPHPVRDGGLTLGTHLNPIPKLLPRADTHVEGWDRGHGRDLGPPPGDADEGRSAGPARGARKADRASSHRLTRSCCWATRSSSVTGRPARRSRPPRRSSKSCGEALSGRRSRSSCREITTISSRRAGWSDEGPARSGWRSSRRPYQSDPLHSLAVRMSATDLVLAYPGLWLRSDVYATHGHYLDCHNDVRTFECLARALVERLKRGAEERLQHAGRLRGRVGAGVQGHLPDRPIARAYAAPRGLARLVSAGGSG